MLSGIKTVHIYSGIYLYHILSFYSMLNVFVDVVVVVVVSCTTKKAFIGDANTPIIWERFTQTISEHIHYTANTTILNTFCSESKRTVIIRM